MIARIFAIAACLVSAAGVTVGEDVLPRPQWHFQGPVGRTPDDSAPPQWPTRPEAPKGAPNVIVILTDDVGFGASSTFGGPIPTPTFDRLAADGLRYNEFHVTALCSPTRAALLTGRNNHDVGVALTEESVAGYEGYTGMVPKSAGTVAEILKQNGYNTAQFGKWHLTPYVEMGPTGPFDHWPVNMGFEYSYGFLAAETNQWQPALVEDLHTVEPPHDDPTYILDRDLADHAIQWIRTQKALAPNKPFFVYYAPGTSHAPHHAPADWIAKFKGKFDQGWDKVREETFERQKKLGIIPAGTKLTPRPAALPAWASLSADQKMVYAHMMEVYAGALAHADYQIGRMIDAVRDMGQLDNTLVIYVQGDNGASAEGGLQGLFNDVHLFNGLPEDFAYLKQHMGELGGPTANNHYPAGWAWAMNTPFQWFKQIASHFGGTQDGMVISWPARIKDKGGVRSQFHHVIDITPTILEAAHVEAPSVLNGVPQKPIEGTSMVYTFDNAEAPSTRRIQYFETSRNRSIYEDGWIAATTPRDLPWTLADPNRGAWDLDDQKWELYRVPDDFSEANNLAAKEPKRVKDLEQLFWAEAARYHVLPMLDVVRAVMAGGSGPPSALGGATRFVFPPGMKRIPEGAAPDLKNRSFRLTAELEVRPGGAEGVLLSEGDRFGGLSFYLLKGKPVFCYNMAEFERTTISAPDALSPGHHAVAADFKYDGGGRGKGGTVTLTVDGKPVASGHVPATIANRFALDASLSVGEATGAPVSDDYATPFRLTAALDRLTVTLN
ncbi:MAG TPA: sulfatase-like hydrolase/transferase [Alphaproteobacteria bacterium]|nr:sulfatase-like hydrolase/transferase [Alphaproteobacteria bacterium]